MPHGVEICLSTVVSAGIFLGLGGRNGGVVGNVLGYFTSYAPLPVLYLAYGLCVWLTLLASCITLRRRLFGQRRVLRKPPRKRNRPARRPLNDAGNPTATQPAPIQPAPVPQPRQIPNTRPNRGEQARRLREVRNGGQPNRAPVYSNTQPLWNSPYPRVSPLIATNVLTNKVNLPKPDAVPVESQKPQVPVSGQPQVAPVAPVREKQHKRRVSPGPYLPVSPATCVRGAYDDEFNRWRHGEAGRKKRYAELGLHFAEKPFDPTGSKARAAEAKIERTVTVPEPVEKPVIPAVEESTAIVVKESTAISAEESSAVPAEESSAVPTEVSSAVPVESTGPVTEHSGSIVESSEPALVTVQVSTASKVKARIAKVKATKARNHAILGRQVGTMSLMDSSIRPVKASQTSPKRKVRSPRRSFEPKPVKRTFEPMDVDYSGDAMDVDVPDSVEQLADLLSLCSISA